MLHIFLIFFKIVCPIASLKAERYYKWIHVCLLFVGMRVPIAVFIWMKANLGIWLRKTFCVFLTEILIPTILVLRKVAPREEQYTIISFPPRRCDDKQDNFFSAILPKSLIALAASVMLVTIGWIIHKVSSISLVLLATLLNQLEPIMCARYFHLAEEGENSSSQGDDHCHLFGGIPCPFKHPRCHHYCPARSFQWRSEHLLSVWSSRPR